MKIKNFFLAYLVVEVLILQNSFSQAKQTQSQSGRAISLIPKFELKLNEKGMPGALSGKSAMCEISSVVYEPKGPLEPNSFFCATVTYKAAGLDTFTQAEHASGLQVQELEAREITQGIIRQKIRTTARQYM